MVGQYCRDSCLTAPWIALATTTSLKLFKTHRSELPAKEFTLKGIAGEAVYFGFYGELLNAAVFIADEL
jgi:hypothetical protein